MIKSEQNTLFSSLLSQKNDWSPKELIELAKSLLSPFDSLNISELEQSQDVSMLVDIVNVLPFKLSCYKSIVSELYKNNGMTVEELCINVFNSDSGLDSISFIYNLLDKGYEVEHIKEVRLFSNNECSLKRSLLLHRYLFPSVKLSPYLLDVNDIENESKCNSLLTVNIFPHTYNLSKNICKQIGDLLISSHQLYSHSIFLEFVSDGIYKSISPLDCSYYWLDLNKTRFIQQDSKSFEFKTRKKSTLSPYVAKYCIFSNLSLETLESKHEFKIVLDGLCPGVPNRKLFNEKMYMLFYETPFEGNSEIDSLFDDENVVTTGYSHVDLSEIKYTLLGAIKNFPQYNIAESLDAKEPWAERLYDFYLEQAENGNYTCYNNLAVIHMLRNSTSDDAVSLESDFVVEIIDLLKNAISGGNIDAMKNLASLYMSKGNHEEALKYYQMAYENGSPIGAFSIAVSYHFGLCGVSIDTAKAISCYKHFFDMLAVVRKNDSESIPKYLESQCCLNLILLMYDEEYSFCDITREYYKIKEPSEALQYAYAVMYNNKYNRATKDFFKILKFLDAPEEKEPSHITFNRLYAIYNGIKNGENEIASNRQEAYNKLKELSDTSCPDWPEWEQYVWRTLAWWADDLEESPVIINSYWLKAIKAKPQNQCAYRTNIALSKALSDDEIKSIWHKYALGNGCPSCHECDNYDDRAKCCPKAQLYWARDYESDSSVASYMLNCSANQNYVRAIEELAINRVYKAYDSDISISHIDNILWNFGIVPDALNQCANIFASEQNYNLLCRAANRGSKKAITLLAKITENNKPYYEHVFWTLLTCTQLVQFKVLAKLSNRTLTDGYFYPSSLIEADYLNCAKKIAEQFLGEKEDAFAHVKKLAEFYVLGKCYHKAVELYQIASEKGFDVSDRIAEIETLIEEEEAQRMSWRDSHYDYDDHDYGADTWDALTDGMYGDYPGPGVDYDFLGFD